MGIVVSNLKFLAIIALFGQLTAVLTITERLNYLKQWGGVGLTFYEKLLVFINFIQGCFIRPLTGITIQESWQGTFPSYILSQPSSLNLVGLAFLCWTTVGFFLSAKDKFAQICFAWIVASFLILCVGGWGTSGNEMGLYIYYFGWAYFCLAFLAIEKLLQKVPRVKYAVYIALIAFLTSINIPGIYDLIQFGIEYYPVQ